MHYCTLPYHISTTTLLYHICTTVNYLITYALLYITLSHIHYCTLLYHICTTVNYFITYALLYITLWHIHNPLLYITLSHIHYCTLPYHISITVHYLITYPLKYVTLPHYHNFISCSLLLQYSIVQLLISSLLQRYSLNNILSNKQFLMCITYTWKNHRHHYIISWPFVITCTTSTTLWLHPYQNLYRTTHHSLIYHRITTYLTTTYFLTVCNRSPPRRYWTSYPATKHFFISKS